MVKKVYYPGLEGIEIAQKQMRRYGGMVVFEINGNIEQTIRVIDRIVHQEIGYIAVSLGLPYTLFDYPAGMTHFFVPREERMKKGITDTLIRLSIGLEDSHKIIKTLNNIFENVK